MIDEGFFCKKYREYEDPKIRYILDQIEAEEIKETPYTPPQIKGNLESPDKYIKELTDDLSKSIVTAAAATIDFDAVEISRLLCESISFKAPLLKFFSDGEDFEHILNMFIKKIETISLEVKTVIDLIQLTSEAKNYLESLNKKEPDAIVAANEAEKNEQSKEVEYYAIASKAEKYGQSIDKIAKNLYALLDVFDKYETELCGLSTYFKSETFIAYMDVIKTSYLLAAKSNAIKLGNFMPQDIEKEEYPSEMFL